ncbi:potassium channel family protein [Paludibacter jiangxiensis]|uniref:Voltage-gated potassium channel n=1 Tax=Paludibacter jiangxiensis TaxID=681398 RepID=A0A161L7U2_9BACT|nr:potassium channel protein [Paludibacter jiangxiensis]GAT62904.1 voltage-gated potassium channel [Paludibacter jiangxiensis]
MNRNIRSQIWRQFLVPISALILILIVGILGYIFIEGYTPLNALYMMVITFATIGYGEPQPLSAEGRIFTILLIISGFTAGFYAIGKLSSFLLEGELAKLLKIKRMNTALENMKSHYIVCGYGKTGKRVTEDLLRTGKKVVLIESNPERNEKLKDFYDKNLVHIIGDATNDEILIQAGIERAKILIAVLTSDAENLFVTLSAKDLNKDIKVITRVEDASSAAKFRKAGTDFIISQIDLASDRIVSLATSTTDFFSFVELTDGKEELRDYKFRLVEIRNGSDLIGKTYREANIPQRTNLVVIGCYSADSDLQVNPKADDIISLGDRLLVFGKDDEITLLKKIGKEPK